MRLIAITGLFLLTGCTTDPVYREASRTAEAARYYPVETLDFASIARGKALVESRCAACHSVGPTGESPSAAAPPLRHLGTRYPVADLQEAFAEGITNGHPEMPQITLESDEIADLIVYLQDVQNHSKP
ncbi:MULTISPECIES: c-type cytochrome [Brevundimonas]|uniref:c-type cytochrome n=1 Tax=Brevundimonas TaxID=41275 RepID=UPI002561B2A5|nr:cytochrome c [Brevundimonas sp.]MDK2747536.1 cytochrome c [Brevundimonas sp.]MEA3474040.1 cytochrome c [Pseudomonadota bacterium]